MRDSCLAGALVIGISLLATSASADAKQLAQGAGAIPSLAGDWTYYGGSGKVVIRQQGNHILLESTWLPNPAPGPHYKTDAVISGANIDGVWRCFVAPCAGEHGKYHAEIAPGATKITQLHSEDPGNRNEINGAVLVPVPKDAPAMEKKLAAIGTVEVYTILFDTDQAVIKPESKPTIAEIAKVLTDDPALKLEVAGHTDNTGTSQHNLALSQHRAQAVVASLTLNFGIKPDRLNAKGYGDTRPIAPNDSDSNRANNRRVELRKM